MSEDLGINTGGRNSDIERAFEKAAAENAALIKSSAGELLKEIQKLAEKPKGPKRERKKPMTMEDLRNMMREEIEKSRAGTPEAVPEIPQPEPVAGEPEPEGEDAGPSRKELASRKFTERVDRLAKKKARDRLKAAQKKKAAEQKAILRTVTGWDKEEIQDAKPWIQEQREWKRHDARIERAQARAQKKLQRQIARQIGGQKKDIAGYVERGLGLARNVRFHGRMEDTIAHTLIRMLRIGGPYGQALAAVLVAGPVGIKMIEEVVKFLAKKGHPPQPRLFPQHRRGGERPAERVREETPAVRDRLRGIRPFAGVRAAERVHLTQHA